MEKCFIICPIGPTNSETRNRSDKIFKHVFAPVLKSEGYDAVRADKIFKPGMITSHIINLITDSPLVIADLTEGNPNVFYELAIRHATGRPYIQIIEKDEKIPFDISGVRTIQIDLTDIESVEKAKKEIVENIREIKKGHMPDSPISIAASVKLLQNDSEVAEEMLEKLDSLVGWGSVNIDDIDDKLDEIIDKLDRM